MLSAMQTFELFRNTSDYRTFGDREVLFRVGEAGTVAYAVQSGEVEVEVGGRVIYRVGPGELVGEMALIDQEPRSATAIARGEVRAVPLDERTFLFLVQQTPFFALTVMRLMAGRLRQSNVRE